MPCLLNTNAIILCRKQQVGKAQKGQSKLASSPAPSPTISMHDQLAGTSPPAEMQREEREADKQHIAPPWDVYSKILQSLPTNPADIMTAS